MRIALFGGTFDPPHRGHTAIALAAAARFGLTQILFAPAGRQPLKLDTTTAPYADRLAMVRLACADAQAMLDPDVDTELVASDLDAPHPDGTPNYTAATLQVLAARHPAAQLFALVGADAFATLGKWRDASRLLSLAEWIVVSRPGYPLADPAGLALSDADRARIHVLDSVHEDISATALRERLQAPSPGPLDDVLSPSVAAYIHLHHLYRP